MAAPYAELRARSAFSFLRGASAPEDLVARAVELGLAALALTDVDGLYGAVRFHRAAREAGLRPLVGAELSLAEGGRLLVLVRDRTGYRNLCRLVTLGHAGRPKGQSALGLEPIAERAEGLLCLTGGCVAPLRAPAQARARLDALVAAFGPEGVLVELGRHRERAEAAANEALVALARERGLGLVATNDVRYATPPERRVLDVMTCLREKCSLDRAGRRLLPNAERCLKSPAEMAALFSDLPEAIANTCRVAERCAFSLEDLGYRFPDFPVPAGETPFSYLHGLVQAGARWRYRPLEPKHAAQLARELELIARLDLAGYFLLVWDIARFCRERGILAQGRGSAANSAVCYALGITAVDPIGMGMLFERFLSEERESWPDIDLDLPSGAQREEVIQYVYRRYGRHGAAMCADVITFRMRSAVRELARALGLDAERLAHAVALSRGHAYPAAHAALLPEHVAEAGLDPAEPRTALLVELAGRMLHLPRHLGQHSGGMVIAAGRLDELVPIEPASMPGRSVIQWDKDDCADMGIIKVDLLGLGMLRVLAEAVPLVRAHEGVEIDLARLPAGDPGVYALLQRADTVGVFQVESRAQMATLPRMRPRCFYDLVVEVALIRPGPIAGRMVHPYLNRRAGREPVTYPHPLLEPILERTLGVPLFQEQIMRIAMEAAGFSAGQAEQLRRAMTHKRSPERMAAMAEALQRGMAARGIAGRAAEEIVQAIASFALYGFPESHAASFALLVYASAYLKVHHPAAFYCGLLNAWPMGFYHPATLVKDAQRHGQTVRPLDVGCSGWRCRIEPDGAVRLGLRYAAGLHKEAGERIARECGRRRFRDLQDLQRRCRLRRDELGALAELGAFASLGLARREAAWQVAALEAEGHGLLERLPLPDDASPLREMSAAERSAADMRLSGLTTGPHPFAHLRPALRARGVLPAASLPLRPDGQRLRTAGLVIVRQRPATAKGMLFMTLEDETGLANLVVAPDVFAAQRALLVGAPALLVEGRLEKRDGVVNLKAERFWPLEEEAPAVPSRDFH
ncbi:MAG: error-prone DNA polymerase [Deltaproteobacteria bacterium]|nr:error-prone DNA polymerase [Deltaproteobacteria bacterium]